MKRIYMIEDYCIGCHLCEVACITEHSLTKDPVKAFLHEKDRPINRCTVEETENGVVTFSTTCRHCDEPECLRACISGAIQKDERNAVCLDTTQCV
ncbi:MAG TPA: 4Fe-4S dicluster domain-containing protein, partial [Verrucomicrobiae bacterium]|nr:4Fe-4S dicluster domain-containing protein [Verrucomicrobiae bacterium]